MAKKAEPSRLAKALLVTADDMRRVGLMDAATHEKIMLCHLGDKVDKMKMRPGSVLALLLPLLVGGCALGEGMAQAVKSVSKNMSQDNGAMAAQPQQPSPPADNSATPAPIDTTPAPMPAPDQRDDVKVEALPPPR